MKNSFPNIVLHYLYRDAGNYKLYESAVFSNPDGLSLQFVDRAIRSCLIDREFFDPQKWKLRKPGFPVFDDATDHDWCEYLKVEEMLEAQPCGRTIRQWLDDIRNAM